MIDISCVVFIPIPFPIQLGYQLGKQISTFAIPVGPKMSTKVSRCRPRQKSRVELKAKGNLRFLSNGETSTKFRCFAAGTRTGDPRGRSCVEPRFGNHKPQPSNLQGQGKGIDAEQALLKCSGRSDEEAGGICEEVSISP